MTDPAARLEIVRPAVPVDLDGAVLAESWSNDTWLTSGSVLRVCWRGDQDRLVREATLLRCLPAAVPHASVVAAGRTGGLTWVVPRRLPGERVDLSWPALSSRERHDAVAGLAGALKALHGWQPPPVVRQLRQAALTPPNTAGDSVGAGIVPLPIWRLFPLLDWLEDQRGVHSALAGRVRARIGELCPLVSDAEFEDGVVVHGDASFANVLWHQGRLAALLDLEWARLGPPDLELATISGDDAGIQARGLEGLYLPLSCPCLPGFGPVTPSSLTGSTSPSGSGSTTSASGSGSSVPGGASIRGRFRTWPASPCTQACASLNGTDLPATKPLLATSLFRDVAAVTTITVRHCDGRDSTDVRYPPNCW